MPPCCWWQLHHTWPSVRRLRDYACSTAINSRACTQISYSERSSAESWPSVHFSASSSRHAWAAGSTWRASRCWATSGVRQRPTGSSSRLETKGCGGEGIGRSIGCISCRLPLQHKARVARQSSPYPYVNRSGVSADLKPSMAPIQRSCHHEPEEVKKLEDLRNERVLRL